MGQGTSPTTTIGKLFTVVYIFAGPSIILAFIDTVAKETFSRQTRRRPGERLLYFDPSDPETSACVHPPDERGKLWLVQDRPRKAFPS